VKLPLATERFTRALDERGLFLRFLPGEPITVEACAARTLRVAILGRFCKAERWIA